MKQHTYALIRVWVSNSLTDSLRCQTPLNCEGWFFHVGRCILLFLSCARRHLKTYPNWSARSARRGFARWFPNIPKLVATFGSQQGLYRAEMNKRGVGPCVSSRLPFSFSEVNNPKHLQQPAFGPPLKFWEKVVVWGGHHPVFSCFWGNKSSQVDVPFDLSPTRLGLEPNENTYRAQISYASCLGKFARDMRRRCEQLDPSWRRWLVRGKGLRVVHLPFGFPTLQQS